VELQAATAQIKIFSFCADLEKPESSFPHMQMALKNPSGKN